MSTAPAPTTRSIPAATSAGTTTAHARHRLCTRREYLLHTLQMWRALGNRPGGTAQFRSEFFGDVMSVGCVADDLGSNEDDQFGPRRRLVIVSKNLSESGDLVETRNAVARPLMGFADETGQQHG